jgi:hypothetical protein
MKHKSSLILQECLIKSFACKIRISSQINLTSQFFIRTLTFFFSTYPYIHGGNTLLIDENMFNEPYNAFFGVFLIAFMGRTIICWGLFSLTWNFFIYPDMVFPRLYITILLVGLDVLIVMILHSLKCYL